MQLVATLDNGFNWNFECRYYERISCRSHNTALPQFWNFAIIGAFELVKTDIQCIILITCLVNKILFSCTYRIRSTFCNLIDTQAHPVRVVLHRSERPRSDSNTMLHNIRTADCLVKSVDLLANSLFHHFCSAWSVLHSIILTTEKIINLETEVGIISGRGWGSRDFLIDHLTFIQLTDSDIGLIYVLEPSLSNMQICNHWHSGSRFCMSCSNRSRIQLYLKSLMGSGDFCIGDRSGKESQIILSLPVLNLLGTNSTIFAVPFLFTITDVLRSRR